MKCKDCKGTKGRMIPEYLDGERVGEEWDECEACEGTGIEPPAPTAEELAEQARILAWKRSPEYSAMVNARRRALGL